ncbi:unnamed protein product [Phytophthora fragariaefolia]|uniref:Elongator complex protein 5 n=1 Tax=Phytophthora fragariaefolia TaxID=1490495 RepID=A0A9W6YNF5_9STRA|nr:unnamed protein product [Phytophthora fragariaefolia]
MPWSSRAQIRDVLEAGRVVSRGLAEGVEASTKLTHVDYSADATNFQSSASGSQLMSKLMQDIEAVEQKVSLEGATSARPMVVVLDSLNVLLQQTSLQQVLLFLRQLLSHAVVGSVIARLNAGAESLEVTQALAAQATALNGRSSESLEYFHVSSKNIKFFAASDIESQTVALDSAKQKDADTKSSQTIAKKSEFQRKPQPETKPLSTSQATKTDISVQAPLPVRQEDVSFNLSISAVEQRAKSQVQLPYMHQGPSSAPNKSTVGSNAGSIAGAGGSITLFFIDEDDPDWDDDDVDDDLDI